MARTVQSEEEREKRIVLVGEYVKETGASTRETAKYFTKTHFHISNCTVSDYCARYCKMRPEEVDELRGKININTVKTVEDPEVRNRVECHAALLANGMTIQEIAEATNSSFWVVYRDVNTRIQIVNPELYNEIIKPILSEHKEENLRKK